MTKTEQLQEIKVRNILLDQKPFGFSFPQFDQRLFDSIAGVGLISPPILLLEGRSKKFIIVSGFRRILACKKIGMKALPCFIIEEDVKNKEYEKLIDLNLKINLSHRKLNNIEMANLFGLLVKIGTPEEKIIKKYMPELKMEKSRKIYEDILSLNSLDARSKIKTIEWQLPLKTSLALAKFSPASRGSVVKLLEILNPGVNKFKEIILLLEEVAFLQKRSVASVIKRDLFDILRDKKLDRNKQTEKIRQKLKELRYPQLTKLEKKWNKCVKDLLLPPEVKISPPPSFEGKKVKLEISFPNEESARDSLFKINRALEVGALTKLINMVNKLELSRKNR